MTSVPAELGSLTNLTTLWLHGNQLTSVPAELGSLTNLTELWLHGNQLTSVPAELGSLTNLTTLRLDGNQLTSVPAELGSLTNLTELLLNGNQLTSVPAELGSLTNLTTLWLHGNQLTSVPAELGSLTNLTELWLHGNQLTSVPAELGSLTNLTELWLNGNQLTSVPAELGSLTNLTTLWLHGNQLTSVPAELGSLTNLTTLWLHGNQLTSLPAELGSLTNLTTLYLHENQLTSLPAELGSLTNLTELWLNGNQLTSVPAELGSLTNLTELWLNGNQLTSVPAELGSLTNLTHLSLHDNQLSEEILAAAEAGIDALGRLLEELTAGSLTAPLWEGKVLFVGEGEVGKSSLLGALRGDPWDPDRTSTHGLEIVPLDVDHPELDTQLSLNAWDFGGQDVYRPTHQLFFTAPAVYVVVWKPRRGQSQSLVEYWIRTISLRAPRGSRCLVVATHGGPGDHLATIAKDALLRQYEELDLIAGFFEVDSEPRADGTLDPRVSEIKAAIAAEAAALPEMGHQFPVAWTDFRCAMTPGHPDAAAAGYHAPFVRYHELEAEAAAAGIDAEATRVLCAIASRRGQWIHYGDPDSPPKPDDLVVTQPEWLAKAVSYVLNDAPTREASGLLSQTQLSRIWANPANDTQYPPDLYPIFIELMESYDLAYEVAQSLDEREAQRPGQWLVAQLVPESANAAQLAEVEASMTGRSVEWVAEFSDTKGDPAPVPDGLLYRLIVRFHRYGLGVEDQARALHWQGGVVLRHPLYGHLMASVDTEIDGIRLKAVGTRPEALAREVAADIEKVVGDFWRGLSVSFAAACGVACASNRPGTGIFEISHLLKAQQRGENAYPCPARRCGEPMEIETLLSGYEPQRHPDRFDPDEVASRVADRLSPSLRELDRRAEDRHVKSLGALARLGADVERVDQALRGELMPYVAQRLPELRQSLDHLDDRMAELAAQANENLDLYLADTDDPARNGPRLITARAHDPHILRRGWVRTEITFTLWCEHSREPLYALHGDPTKGRYTVPVTRDQIKRVLPVLSLATKVVAGFSPMALVMGDTQLDDRTFESIQVSLDASLTSLNVLSDAVRLADDASVGEAGAGGSGVDLDGGPIQGSALAAVQELIRDKDPDFGGLLRRRDKQRRRLWVDRSNAHHYPEGGAY